MRKIGCIAGALCLAFASSARAEEFEIAGFALDVPARFEGPVTAEPDAHSKTYAFAVHTVVSSPSTVLQITVYDPGIDLGQSKSAELAELSQRYLLQMLQGIERRRTEYRQSEPQSIRLAGTPAAEVTWSGKANGLETNGKMFCVVSGSGLVFLHVMGGGSSPNADMAAAIGAVGKLRKS
jgi:hypothetical protein